MWKKIVGLVTFVGAVAFGVFGAREDAVERERPGIEKALNCALNSIQEPFAPQEKTRGWVLGKLSSSCAPSSLEKVHYNQLTIEIEDVKKANGGTARTITAELPFGHTSAWRSRVFHSENYRTLNGQTL